MGLGGIHPLYILEYLLNCLNNVYSGCFSYIFFQFGGFLLYGVLLFVLKKVQFVFQKNLLRDIFSDIHFYVYYI